MLLAELEHAVAFAAGGLKQIIGTVLRLDAGGRDGQILVFPRGGVVGRPAVIADNAEHGIAVGRVARERTQLGGHLGGGSIGGGVQQGRQGAALGPTFRRVVGDALDHEERAEVGVAQTQGAEVVRFARHGLARELRHVDGDFQDQRP